MPASLAPVSVGVARRMIEGVLRRAGFDVRRESSVASSPVLPPIFDDPLEAFYFQTGRGGQPSAFQCPVAKIIKNNGFLYSRDGYEPSVLAMVEYVSGACTGYAGSHIERYHEWRGAHVHNAADNLMGVRDAPALMQISKHVAVLPWDTVDVQTRQEEIEKTMVNEYLRHGWSDFSVDDHVPEKGMMEFDRCVSVLTQISKEGYQRIHGDIHVTVLRRNGECRFLLSGAGKHRTTAMAALNESHIPACFHGPPRILEMGDVDYWPQVRRNVWPRASALKYFNHLFDFDAREWARQQSLL